MTSDEDRREVARRLRETGEELGSGALLWYHIAKALGVRTSTDGKTACDMLADLIEPDEQKVKCIAEIKMDGERLEQLVNDAVVEVTGIDRDALLALADAVHGMGVDCDTKGNYAFGCTLRAIAERIREALGVRDD